LHSPTENTIAQVKWELQEREDVIVGVSTDIDVPRLYEAEARDHYVAGHLPAAFESTLLWLADQPFSSTPAAMASYIAHLMGRDGEAAEIIRASLPSNPGDPGLLNSLVYAQALTGELEGAKHTFGELASVLDGCTDTILMITRATAGLIEIRSGNEEFGRSLYLQTITEANAKKRYDIKTVALANLAREEALLGNVSEARRLLTEAVGDLQHLRYTKPLEAELKLAERSLLGSFEPAS
jgi:hypothetical protein